MDGPLPDFRIGDHTVQPRRNRIVSRQGEVQVEPRAMAVLVALAGSSGETISRDDLIAAVWKHPHVTDETLSRCIALLRRALGDDGSRPRRIETIPKRGYRLAVPIVVDGDLRARLRVVTPDWSRTNLTLQLTRIIGREAELADVRTLLGKRRLVTLTGSGGVGKTRLAIEVGKGAVSDFRDGAWLAELAALADPDAIPQIVSSALGIDLGIASSPLQELSRRIAGRELVLILDNCEHLIGAAATLAASILETAPGVRILATSRTPLGVAHENLYRVSSLKVPADDRLAFEDIVNAPAVQLFIERANAADARIAADRGNAAAIGSICRRLDGIALAIEMAAARAPLFGVEQLDRLLDERFRVLTGGRRTAPPRQQTLRATLDWSYRLLSEREQAVLSQLGVFAGGFTLEAATTVVSRDANNEVADVLARLIAHSLVVADTHADETRYRLLETTRAYAIERLKGSEDRDDVRKRHLAFYLALAEEAEPKLRSAEQRRLVARLDRERENFLAAFALGDHDEMAARLGLRLAIALEGYWIHRGGIELGLRVTLEAVARRGAQARDVARCRALGAACHLAACLNRHAEMEKYGDESTSIALEAGDEAQLVLVLLGMGGCMVTGKLDEAHRYIYEALPIARRPNGRRVLRNALQVAVEIDRLEGDLAAAKRHALEGLQLGRELEQPVDIGVALLNLAAVSIDESRIEGVAEMLVEALSICENIASKPLGANGLMVTAGMAAYVGDWQRAAQWHAAARHQNEETGWAPEPADEAFITRVIQRARAALSSADFAAADAAGRALSYDQALASARTWLAEQQSNASSSKLRLSRRRLTPRS